MRYLFRLAVGQWCAALFNGDWYRARVLKVEENRVQVQYIDWYYSRWLSIQRSTGIVSVGAILVGVMRFWKFDHYQMSEYKRPRTV